MPQKDSAPSFGFGSEIPSDSIGQQVAIPSEGIVPDRFEVGNGLYIVDVWDSLHGLSVGGVAPAVFFSRRSSSRKVS